MKDFKTIQDLFKKSILSSDSSFLEDEIIPAGSLDAKSAVGVYQNAYTARLTEVLGENFQTVWKILGDDEFFEIAKKYIFSNPSTSYNISNFGALFYVILDQDYSDEFPFLKDLAIFEHQFNLFFHIKEDIFPKFTDFNVMEKNSDFVFEFSESLKLFNFEFPIYTIWKNRENLDFEKIDFSGKESIVLYKKDGEILVKNLSETSFYLFENLLKRNSFLNSVNIVSKVKTIEPDAIQNLFQFLSVSGLIKKIRIAQSDEFLL